MLTLHATETALPHHWVLDAWWPAAPGGMKRTKKYADMMKRKAAEDDVSSAGGTYADFLQSLDLTLDIHELDASASAQVPPRSARLALKPAGLRCLRGLPRALNLLRNTTPSRRAPCLTPGPTLPHPPRPSPAAPACC